MPKQVTVRNAVFFDGLAPGLRIIHWKNPSRRAESTSFLVSQPIFPYMPSPKTSSSRRWSLDTTLGLQNGYLSKRRSRELGATAGTGGTMNTRTTGSAGGLLHKISRNSQTLHLPETLRLGSHGHGPKRSLLGYIFDCIHVCMSEQELALLSSSQRRLPCESNSAWYSGKN